jgi:hypothetical protein
MHPLITHQLADQQQRLLLLRAAKFHTYDSPVVHDNGIEPLRKASVWKVWYRICDLSVPLYDLEDVGMARKHLYEWLRQRTRALLLTVGCATFALGILLGGLLERVLSLGLVISVAVIAALVAFGPFLLRTFLLLKKG